MTTLSAFDLANHWPFIRRHLALARTPAQARALDVLAAETVEHRGEPVAMRRALLERPYGPPGRERPATAGEAGNAWRALERLRQRGVVMPYEGSGRRGHLWHFLPANFGRQWREMPWVSSARRVASTVEACRCRAEFPVLARIPGQSVELSRDSAGFLLEPDDHLAFRAPDARQSRQLARLVADELGIRLATARQEPVSGRPIPLPGSSFGTTPLHEEDETEDAAVSEVAWAIFELCGKPLYTRSRPRARLTAAMSRGGLDPALVRSHLRRIREPTHEGCLAVVEELARGGVTGASSFDPEAAKREARLAAYRRAGEDVPEELLATVGGHG